jgi:glycosyltransferase involved in cell wall biosynthesis
MTPKYSIVIPVYNRPVEVDELLDSLTHQTLKDFEVIIIEDGSSVSCEPVILKYQTKLQIRYFFKINEGPGPARNFGFQQARGSYFVVFDSDCIIPPSYFEAVEEGVNKNSLDAWGGPDRAHQNFTAIQRAMGYTMASVLTTGGIRGGKQRIGWFQPRSFNMGISRKVFEITGGFLFTHFAEDIELSIRMKNAGVNVGLIEKAYVYHKRRTTFGQFFKQVFNFGKGRARIGAVYPGEVKLTHWFPTIFTACLAVLLVLPLLSRTLFIAGLSAFCFYLFLIFAHALFQNKNPAVALLSIPSAILQLTGYGLGFFKERVKTYLRKTT